MHAARDAGVGMQELWFYAGAHRKAVGPCSRDALLALRASGDIRAHTLVWKAGTDAWMPYANTVLASAPVAPSTREPLSAPLAVVCTALEPVAANGIPAEATAPIARETQPLAAASPSSIDETEPVSAVATDYGVASPRSFRSGGGSRPTAAASEPPSQPVDDDGWQYTRPGPWRRYLARLFDTVLLGSLIWLALATLFLAFSPGIYQALYGPVSVLNNAVSKSILTFAAVIPVEAWILGLTGTTAGKWVFGVRITHGDGRAIGFAKAIRREGAVFLQGLALGIPLFSTISKIIAFFRLRSEGATGWDAGKPWVVTYRPRGAAQTCLFISGTIVLIAAMVGLRLLVATKKG